MTRSQIRSQSARTLLLLLVATPHSLLSDQRKDVSRKWTATASVTVPHGIADASYSPDGQMIAYVGTGDDVTLLDVPTHRFKKPLKGHTDWVWSVTFSPNSKLIASAGKDRTVRLWDVKSGKQIRLMKEHEAVVHAVVFSPDGKKLASADEKGRIIVRSIAGDTKNKTANVDSGANTLRFSPNGKWIAAGCFGGNVVVLRVSDMRKVRTFETSTDFVATVGFLKEGQTLFAGCGRRKFQSRSAFVMWDVATRKTRLDIRHRGRMWAFAVSPDERMLAIGCGNLGEHGYCGLWDIKTKKTIVKVSSHKDAVTAVSFAPSGKHLMSASRDGVVRFWDLARFRSLKNRSGE